MGTGLRGRDRAGSAFAMWGPGFAPISRARQGGSGLQTSGSQHLAWMPTTSVVVVIPEGGLPDIRDRFRKTIAARTHLHEKMNASEKFCATFWAYL